MPALARLVCLMIASVCAGASPALAAEAWTVDCGGSGRCTAVQTLVNADTGKPFASVGLQINKDGRSPVFFAIIPLGIAVRPGIRAIIGKTELLTQVDVCYPDGCRASLDLDEGQLAALLDGSKLDLQFFPYTTSDTPVAGATDISGLRAALSGQVAFR